jgi:hypothetical protein
VARRVVCRWEWVDGIVVAVTKSLLLYTFFPFWGRDVDGGREVSFPLSALREPGCSPLPSFLCLFHFSVCLLLKLVSSLSDDSNWFEFILIFLYGPASST